MLQIRFRAGEMEVWKAYERKQKYAPTSQPKKKTRRKRETAAKKPKKHPRVSFQETAVGHFLYVYVPVEYYLLMEYANPGRVGVRKRRITPNVIEHIALKSNVKAFRTARFRQGLIAFRRYGLRPKHKVQWTLKDAVHFAKYSFQTHQQMQRCAE